MIKSILKNNIPHVVFVICDTFLEVGQHSFHHLSINLCDFHANIFLEIARHKQLMLMHACVVVSTREIFIVEHILGPMKPRSFRKPEYLTCEVDRSASTLFSTLALWPIFSGWNAVFRGRKEVTERLSEAFHILWGRYSSWDPDTGLLFICVPRVRNAWN